MPALRATPLLETSDVAARGGRPKIAAEASLGAPAPLWPDFAASAAAGWWTAALGVTAYWAGALGRGAAPLDVAADAARFWEIAVRRERPAWATPNTVVLRSPLARLRSFCEPSATTGVPTLVVAPQSGHASSIIDYSPQQSQVDAMRMAGLGRVYALDWRGATQATKDAGIEDYVAVLDAAVEALGGRANLIGDSQGGWLAAIYAALRPACVNTLTVAGAPIDFHAGRPLIQRMVELLGVPFFERLVALGGGVMRGDDVHRGFVLIEPENEVAKQFELLARLDDAKHVARYRAFEDWHKHTQDIPGRLYLWTVEHLFRDNELIRGELRVGGERVDLGRIRAPVNLLAGARDRITPPGQVFALADAVSTEPRDVVQRTTGGGHLGLFMGREALREHWPPILAGVLERSRL